MEQDIVVTRTSINGCFQELSMGVRDVQVTVGGHLVWKGTIEKASTTPPWSPISVLYASLVPRVTWEEEDESLGMGQCTHTLVSCSKGSLCMHETAPSYLCAGVWDSSV